MLAKRWMWRRGYRLFNLVAGQCEAVTDKEYRRYLNNRFWKLTLEEAREAEVTMTCSCQTGCFETKVDIVHCASGAKSR